ncbi:hypothetical protein OHA19_21765 [Streptomyces sp. NBC_00012]|uniref:hypothetical protein n=1 Tax=Streptomyces sp. NBC_00012 TaxID=2975621 RepID=UPI0032488AE5
MIAAAGFLFPQRLTSGLDASPAATLRAQADAEVVRLDVRGPLPHLPPSSPRDPDGGLGTGGAERVAQVLAPDGRLLAFTDGAGGHPLADTAQVRAATRGEVGFTASIEGQDYRMLAVPAENDGKEVAVLVGVGPRLADAATTHTRDALMLGGPPPCSPPVSARTGWPVRPCVRWTGCADGSRRSPSRTPGPGWRRPPPTTRSRLSRPP